MVAVMLISGVVSAESIGSELDDKVYNLVTSFCGDAKTSRGFAWSVETDYTDMAIQYAKKGELTASSAIVKANGTLYNERIYYKADITGLDAGTTYEYRIGVAKDDKWSKTYTFTTEAEDVTDFSFIGVTDPQSSSWSSGFKLYNATLNTALQDEPDAAFMVVAGDLINRGTNTKEWDDYFKATKGITESLPHMAAAGNHEVYYEGDEAPATEMLGKLFSLQFNHPDNGKGALGSLTADDVEHVHNKGLVINQEDTIYSFDYGNAHFVVLNTGSDYKSSDHKKLMTEQAKWLKEDLKATDKKWKIVISHIGIYPAKTERWHARDILLPVYQECGVDLVINGHDHMVARTKKDMGQTFAILGSAGPKRYDPVEEQAEYLEVLHNTDKNLPVYYVFDVNEDRIKMTAKQTDGTILDEFDVLDTDSINTEIEKNKVTLSKFVPGISEITVLVTYPETEGKPTGEDICYIGEAYAEKAGLYTLQFADRNKSLGEYNIKMNLRGAILEKDFEYLSRMYLTDGDKEIENLSDITSAYPEAKLEMINTDNGRLLCAQYKDNMLVDVDFVDVKKGAEDGMTIEYKGSVNVDQIKLFFWDKTTMAAHMKEVIIY